MPRPPARLSNCYVPLQLNEGSSSRLNTATASTSESSTSLRTGRKNTELRQLCLETGVVSRQVQGSSLVELGHTKVLCQVSISTTHPDALQDEGILECKVKYAPHIGIDASMQRAQSVVPLESTISVGKLNSETMAREKKLSAQLHSSLVSVLPLKKFPKAALLIHVTVLQDDGSALSICVTAASMALVDAQVEILDLVTSCTVAAMLPAKSAENTIEESDPEPEMTFLADPTEAEMLGASAIICLAMTPNLKEVTLWSQSGRLDSSEANEAIQLCRNGCRTMHKFMREVWVAKQ